MSMVSALASAPSAAGPESDTAVRSVICPPKAAAWSALLAAWIRIETASKFEIGKSALPSKGRPAEVSRWIGGHHTKVPEVRNVTAYAKPWWKWWDSMQPE
ncbi:hypothetical protein K438DRAFT_1748105 [Mycena galopus ATCC 62051]|nr:hypothetical protein K438DRAFT_1748105 [Mycena galopus ATCC 62051]